jgi:hypothetical protein
MIKVYQLHNFWLDYRGSNYLLYDNYNTQNSPLPIQSCTAYMCEDWLVFKAATYKHLWHFHLLKLK